MTEIDGEKYLRLPPPRQRGERHPFGRGFMMARIKSGDVKGACLRLPGAKRGVWIYSAKSMDEWLEKQMAKGEINE